MRIVATSSTKRGAATNRVFYRLELVAHEFVVDQMKVAETESEVKIYMRELLVRIFERQSALSWVFLLCRG